MKEFVLIYTFLSIFYLQKIAQFAKFREKKTMKADNWGFTRHSKKVSELHLKAALVIPAGWEVWI